MITVSNIYVQYGERILLDNVSCVIGNRDKIGLVGRNGAGKSTLIKIIAGYQNSEKGSIAKPSGTTIGFLHQEIEIKTGKTVMDETLTAFEEALKIESRIEAINTEIGSRDDYESQSYHQLLDELSEANDRFNMLGGFSMQSDAEKVLKGLGFKQSDFTRKTDEFSGGWKMRIELAKILLRKPNYLLLDEPNNHLDIEAIIWLEQFLRDYEGAVVIISHDKMFLDNITNRTIEIEFGKLYDYKAHYSKYVELRALRREKLEAEFKNQQAKIAQTEKLIDKFRAKASKAKFAQSLIKQLDRMDKVEIDPEDSRAMRIRFKPAPRSGDIVVEGKDIIKHYGQIKVLQGVDLKLDRGERVAFVGQNGQGKTTLSRILIEDLELTEGVVKIGHNIHIGYYAQNQAETLPSHLTLLEALEHAAPPEMFTQVRSILGAFLFSGEDVEKKVSVLSGGERARLALACLLLRPLNLLVLDEPTNHLDIISKDLLKQALQKYDGTLIVVSHDRDFLQELTTRTIEFKDHKLFEHLGDVTSFLEKRKIDSMRELGIKKKENRTASSSNKASKLSYEEQKEQERQKRRLEKKVQTAERKIDKLERQIADFESQMGATDFYHTEGHQEVLEAYQKAQVGLEEAMSSWEEAHEELESFLSK
ncbi:MAG: ABC-F family ATP-binding cassette domain-containing protein [Bacteroidota bacterium]